MYGWFKRPRILIAGWLSSIGGVSSALGLALLFLAYRASSDREVFLLFGTMSLLIGLAYGYFIELIEDALDGALSNVLDRSERVFGAIIAGVVGVAALAYAIGGYWRG